MKDLEKEERDCGIRYTEREDRTKNERFRERGKSLTEDIQKEKIGQKMKDLEKEERDCGRRYTEREDRTKK